MTDRSQDRHASNPVSLRLGADRERVKEAAARAGMTEHGWIVDAVREKLDREEAAASVPVPVFPQAVALAEAVRRSMQRVAEEWTPERIIRSAVEEHNARMAEINHREEERTMNVQAWMRAQLGPVTEDGTLAYVHIDERSDDTVPYGANLRGWRLRNEGGTWNETHTVLSGVSTIVTDPDGTEYDWTGHEFRRSLAGETAIGRLERREP